MENNNFEKNGTGVVYHGSTCGSGMTMSYQDGGEGAASECGTSDILHPDLIAIIWDVIQGGEEEVMDLPKYGFAPHFWTIEELKEAYKTKTGNDFVA